MTLPLWFLVLTLFLPRLGLFCGWIHGWHFEIPQPAAGFVWFFVPRVLVLMMIYASLGFCPWFWLHVGAAVLAYIRGMTSSAARKPTEGKQ